MERRLKLETIFWKFEERTQSNGKPAQGRIVEFTRRHCFYFFLKFDCWNLPPSTYLDDGVIMKASKRSLWLQSISLLQQFSIEFRKFASKLKTKTNPSFITHVFSRLKKVAWFSFEFSMVNVDVNLCIDSREYFVCSLSKVRVRWFFDNQFKTSLSRIYCISNILSL